MKFCKARLTREHSTSYGNTFQGSAFTNADGVGNYKGNFGNLLFFWDVLFGSAHITRKYPESVGLKDDRLFGQERWYHQMFYPFLQSRRDHTALKFGGRAYAEAETSSDAAADAPGVKHA